jgi:hypothetical protein
MNEAARTMEVGFMFAQWSVTIVAICLLYIPLRDYFGGRDKSNKKTPLPIVAGCVIAALFALLFAWGYLQSVKNEIRSAVKQSQAALRR